MKVFIFTLTVAISCAALYFFEGTDIQAFFFVLLVVTLAYVAIGLLQKSRQSSASDAALAKPSIWRRSVVFGGMATGFALYAGWIANARVRTAPMPNYPNQRSLPPVKLKLTPPMLEQTGRTIPTPDGPYYFSGTPEARDIAVAGTPGRPLIFQGRVVDQKMQPIRSAAIEIWHANGEGDYDNSGHNNCRGHQFTDENGCFEFYTVKPMGYGAASNSITGIIDFRAAHIHIKILTPSGLDLTTQVFFPDDPRNPTDMLYDTFKDTLIVNLANLEGALHARFDFVL